MPRSPVISHPRLIQRALLLKELMPDNKAAFVGKKVEVPTLFDVVTSGMEKGQRRLSHDLRIIRIYVRMLRPSRARVGSRRRAEGFVVR